MPRLIVRGARVVLPGGTRPASIHIDDGRIEAVRRFDDLPAGVPLVDAAELVVLPGLVDTHVHINDPGRSDWEGFESATRAAAAGGVTTLIDMPLNSVPPTTTVAGLQAKLRAAERKCHVDVGFWGGVVPGNVASLEPLAAAGVYGFKCFLSPSGVEEFAPVAEPDLRAAMPILSRLGLPLLVHAELPAFLREADAASDPTSYATWLDSRPSEAEHQAIALLLRLGREYRTRIHIVHLASADAVPALAAARAEGLPVSVETCPHYLTFAAEEIEAGATPFKCAPPIRSHDHRTRLWEALATGDIDLVATDHSPAPLELKHVDDGDFVRAWGGISSLQLGLPIVWTGAAARRLTIEDVAAWMAGNPARLAGLARMKGAIETGRDADLVLWDPATEGTVDPDSLQHRHPITPYAGRRLRGTVRMTLLRGDVVFDNGRFPLPPRGRSLLRGVEAMRGG